MQELPNAFSYPLRAGAKELLLKSQNKTADKIIIGHAEGIITSGTCFHVLFFHFYRRELKSDRLLFY